VQALNDAWGLKFWSMEFTAWGEVPTPRCRRACLGHTLDFHRFYSDSQVEYIKVQHDALRATVAPRQFVSHNSTGIFDRGIDHRDYARALDVAGWDAYRGAAAAGHGLDAAATALAHDLFRCALNKPFWIFETSPEPVTLASSEVVTSDGQTFVLQGPHGEWLEPGEGCEVLARFRGGQLDGKSAAYTRVFGKGRVFYAAAQACDGLNGAAGETGRDVCRPGVVRPSPRRTGPPAGP
jgi:hypothetical protein